MDKPEVIESFFGVYLLYSQNPKYLGRTYIGYTVDPNRRINQHNKGCWAGGARQTSNRGPWKMIMIIHGFPNNIAALRFEWAWQNPTLSRRLQHVQPKQRKESRLQFRLRVLGEMLRAGPWHRLPLVVRWLAEEFAEDFAPDKLPPVHMPICHGPVRSKKLLSQDGRKGLSQAPPQPPDCFCSLCTLPIDKPNTQLCCPNSKCDLRCHIHCLGELFLEVGEYVPVEGECPFCRRSLLWGDLVRRMKGCSDLEPADGSDGEDALGTFEDELYCDSDG